MLNVNNQETGSSIHSKNYFQALHWHLALRKHYARSIICLSTLIFNCHLCPKDFKP